MSIYQATILGHKYEIYLQLFFSYRVSILYRLSFITIFTVCKMNSRRILTILETLNIFHNIYFAY